MRDIKAMLPEEIAAALAEMGQPKYRAKQIFQWLPPLPTVARARLDVV